MKKIAAEIKKKREVWASQTEPQSDGERKKAIGNVAEFLMTKLCSFVFLIFLFHLPSDFLWFICNLMHIDHTEDFKP